MSVSAGRDYQYVEDDEQLRQLRREFDAEEGTFLLNLRGGRLEWDKAAFSRVEKTMRWACENFRGHDQLDRWIAGGFYEVSRFVRNWTSHPRFPWPQPGQYYDDCIERLDDLADWFFRSYHAYRQCTTGQIFRRRVCRRDWMTLDELALATMTLAISIERWPANQVHVLHLQPAIRELQRSTPRSMTLAPRATQRPAAAEEAT